MKRFGKRARSLLSFGFILAFWLIAACSTSARSWRQVPDASIPPTVQPADVIYQAFDVPFDQVKAQLPKLKQQGYTYIQVSPPQKSHPAENWWARYQPIDHTVLQSPLGDEQSLRSLIRTAHRQRLKILVDVVLNHMANYADLPKTFNYPRFSAQDFHPQSCIDYRDRRSVTQGWLNCDLPDLNTRSDYVRQEAKNYLNKLLALGVDGFRFDATKHIEPDYFKAILLGVPAQKFVYGEVIGETLAESNEYTGIFPISDFHLLRTMIAAFSLGGDLRSLINPATQQKALPGTQAIVFANNHDLQEGQLGMQFATELDKQLANAFVLAQRAGIPFIYLDDAKVPLTQAGVAFHRQMARQPQLFRPGNEIAPGADSANLLFLERGDRGLAIFNKAAEAFDVPEAHMPGLAIGCYQELHHSFTVTIRQDKAGQKTITRWGRTQRPGMQIPARDALFLVKTKRQACD
jgi:alpha-amylase